MAKKGITVKDSDSKEIDKLFEKMTKEAMANMTGTGYNPAKKKATKSTATKKVKRK